MFRNAIAPYLEKLKRALGTRWNPLESVESSRLFSMNPEIELRNVPLPQMVLDLSELPLTVDYSDIQIVKAKFSWRSLLGWTDDPIHIQAENAEVRLRFSYPSEWDVDFWRDRSLKKEAKRLKQWTIFGSSFSNQVASSSVKENASTRITNLLDITLKNAHVTLVDDHTGQVPFAIETIIDEIKVSAPGSNDPRLTAKEKKGISAHLLSSLWIRFLGMHIFLREFSTPRLPDRRAVYQFLKENYSLMPIVQDRIKKRQAAVETDALHTETETVLLSPLTALYERIVSATSEVVLKTLRREMAGDDANLERKPSLTIDFLNEVAASLSTEELIRSLAEAEQREAKLPPLLLSRQSQHGRSPRRPSRRRRPRALRLLTRDERLLRRQCSPSSSGPPIESDDDAQSAYSSDESLFLDCDDEAPSYKRTADTRTYSASRKRRRKYERDTQVASRQTVSVEECPTHGKAMSKDDLFAAEEEEVARLRKQGVFDSTSEPDLLRGNNHAIRVTSPDGLEMHIFTKKWDIRALSIYDLRKVAAKEASIAFIAADSTRRKNVPSYDRADPLEILITSSVLEAIFAFVKQIELFGAFTKGAAASQRTILTTIEAERYCGLVRQLFTETNKVKLASLQAEVSAMEAAYPMPKLLELRERAVSELRAETQTKDRSAGARRVFGWAQKDPTEVPQRESQRGNSGGKFCCSPAAADIFESASDREERRETEALLGPGIPEGSGWSELRWFFSEGRTEIILPRLRATLVPLVKAGLLTQTSPLTSIGATLHPTLRPFYPDSLSPCPKQSMTFWKRHLTQPSKGGQLKNSRTEAEMMRYHLGVFETQTFDLRLEVKTEKWTVFKKANYVLIKDIMGFKSEQLLGVDVRSRMVNSQKDWDKEAPTHLLALLRILEYPPQLVVGHIANVVEDRSRVKSLTPKRLAKLSEVTDAHSPAPEQIQQCAQDCAPVIASRTFDEERRPTVKVGERDDNYITLMCDYYWKRDLTMLDPSATVLIAIEDDQTISKRMTQILLPQLHLVLDWLMEFLCAFPPIVTNTQDRLLEKDCPRDPRVTQAATDTYTQSSLFKDTIVAMPNAVVTFCSKSQKILRRMELDAAIISLASPPPRAAEVLAAKGKLDSSLAPQSPKSRAAAAQNLWPFTFTDLMMGIAGFRFSIDMDSTMAADVDTVAIKVLNAPTSFVRDLANLKSFRLRKFLSQETARRDTGALVKPTVLLIDVKSLDAISGTLCADLAAMMPQLLDTLFGLIDFREFDERVKQFTSVRDLKQSRGEVDEHPELQVPKSLMARKIPAANAIATTVLREAGPDLGGDTINLLINCCLGRVSLLMDSPVSSPFGFCLADMFASVGRGCETETLSISTSLREIFGAIVEENKSTVISPIITKHVAAIETYNSAAENNGVSPLIYRSSQTSSTTPFDHHPSTDLTRIPSDPPRDLTPRQSKDLSIDEKFKTPRPQSAEKQQVVVTFFPLLFKSPVSASRELDLQMSVRKKSSITSSWSSNSAERDGDLFQQVADSLEGLFVEDFALTTAEILSRNANIIKMQNLNEDNQVRVSFRSSKAEQTKMRLDASINSLFFFIHPVVVYQLLLTLEAHQSRLANIGAFSPLLVKIFDPPVPPPQSAAAAPTAAPPRATVQQDINIVISNLVLNVKDESSCTPTPRYLTNPALVPVCLGCFPFAKDFEELQDETRIGQRAGALLTIHSKFGAVTDDRHTWSSLIKAPTYTRAAVNASEGCSLSSRVNLSLKLRIDDDKNGNFFVAASAEEIEVAVLRDLDLMLLSLNLDTLTAAIRLSPGNAVSPVQTQENITVNTPTSPACPPDPLPTPLIAAEKEDSPWSDAYLLRCHEIIAERRSKELTVKQKKQDDRDRLVDFASLEIFGFVVWVGQLIVGEVARPGGEFFASTPAEGFELGASRDLTVTTLRCLPRRPPLTSFTSAKHRRTLLSPLLQAAQDIVIRPPSEAPAPKEEYSPAISITAWSRTSSLPSPRPKQTYFASAHIGSILALLDGNTLRVLRGLATSSQKTLAEILKLRVVAKPDSKDETFPATAPGCQKELIELLSATDSWMSASASGLRGVEEKLKSIGFMMGEVEMGRLEVTFTPSFSAATRVFISDVEVLRYINGFLLPSLSPSTRRLIGDRLSRELGHYAFCVLNEGDGMTDVPPAPVLMTSLVTRMAVLPTEALEALPDLNRVHAKMSERTATPSRGLFAMASLEHRSNALGVDLDAFAKRAAQVLAESSQIATEVFTDFCETALSFPITLLGVKLRISMPIFSATLGLWHIRAPPPKSTTEIRREITHALNVQDAVNQFPSNAAVQDAADSHLTTPTKFVVPPLISSNTSENFIFRPKDGSHDAVWRQRWQNLVSVLVQHLDFELSVNSEEGSSSISCALTSLFVCDQAGLPIILKKDAGQDLLPKGNVARRGSAQLDALLSNETVAKSPGSKPMRPRAAGGGQETARSLLRLLWRTDKSNALHVDCSAMRVEADAITVEELAESGQRLYAALTPTALDMELPLSPLQLTPSASSPTNRLFWTYEPHGLTPLTLRDFIPRYHVVKRAQAPAPSDVVEGLGVVFLTSFGPTQPSQTTAPLTPDATAISVTTPVRNRFALPDDKPSSADVRLERRPTNRADKSGRRTGTNRNVKPIESGKLRVEFGVHGLEVWMFPGSVEARDRRKVVESAWRVLTPYPEFQYFVQHPVANNFPAPLSVRPLILEASQEVEEEGEEVDLLTHDTSSVSSVEDESFTQDTRSFDIGVVEGSSGGGSEEMIKSDESALLFTTTAKTHRGLKPQFPSASVVRSSTFTEPRPFKLSTDKRAHVWHRSKVNASQRSDKETDGGKLFSIATAEVAFGLFANLQSRFVLKDTAEASGRVMMSLHVASGAPIPFQISKSLIPMTALEVYNRGRHCWTPGFLGLSGSRLSSETFTTGKYEDVILSIEPTILDARVLRCFGQGPIRDVPQEFGNIKFHTMSGEARTFQSNLLCPTSLKVGPIRLQASTGLLFQILEIAKTLQTRAVMAARAWVPQAAQTTNTSLREEQPNDSDLGQSADSQTDLQTRLSSPRTATTFVGMCHKTLVGEDAHEDEAALWKAAAVSKVIMDNKYRLSSSTSSPGLMMSAKEEQQILTEYKDCLVGVTSKKAVARAIWNSLCGRDARSIIYHLSIWMAEIQVAVLDRHVQAAAVSVENLELSGPLPMVGDSTIEFSTTARLRCWNPFANRCEEVMRPVELSAKMRRSCIRPEILSFPTVDISASASALSLSLSAGPLQNLFRLYRSIRTNVSFAKAHMQSHTLIVNVIGAPIGISVLDANANSLKPTGPMIARANKWLLRSYARTVIPDIGQDDTRLKGLGILYDGEFSVEDSSAEVNFSILRQTVRSRQKPTRKKRAGINTPGRTDEQECRRLNTSFPATSKLAIKRHQSAAETDRVPTPELQRRSSTMSANMIGEIEDIDPDDDMRRNQNVYTQQQLGKLWLDLLAMGDTEFLSVARILAEDPELLLSTSQAYDITGTDAQTKAEEHREMQRSLIDKDRPYRRYLKENQSEMLFSTTRHVQQMLESLIDDAPFLLKNRLASLSNVSLQERLFKQSSGWMISGTLNLDSEGPRAYKIDGLGYRVVVEPQPGPSSADLPERAFYVATNVQIENVTCMPLVIGCHPRPNRLRNIAQKLIHLPLESLPRPLTRTIFNLRARALYRSDSSEYAGVAGAHNETEAVVEKRRSAAAYVVVEPYTKATIPLSWFVDPKGLNFHIYPNLDGDENGGVGRGANVRRRSFAQLHELLVILEAKERLSTLRKSSHAVSLVLEKRLTKLTRGLQTIPFSKGLVLTSTVFRQDIATDLAANLAARYQIRIEPQLFLTNDLACPVTVWISPRFNAVKAEFGKSSTAWNRSSRHRRAVSGLHVPTTFTRTNISPLGLRKLASDTESWRLLLNQPVLATIPSNWTWGLPFATPALEISVSVHGLPIEPYTEAILPAMYRDLTRVREAHTEHAQLTSIVVNALRAFLGPEVAHDSQLVGESVLLLQHGRGALLNDTGAHANPTKVEPLPTYATVKPESIWLHGAEALNYRLNAVVCRPETISFPPDVTHACSLVECVSRGNGRVPRATPLRTRDITVIDVTDPSQRFAKYPVQAVCSRRSISLFPAFMIENCDVASLILCGGVPIPPNCRVVFGDEECHNMRIEVIQQHPKSLYPAITQLSSKLDFSSNPNTALPPIVLDFIPTVNNVVSRGVGVTASSHRERIQRRPSGVPSVAVAEPLTAQEERHRTDALKNAVRASIPKKFRVHSSSHEESRGRSGYVSSPGDPPMGESDAPKAAALGVVLHNAEVLSSQARIVSFVPYYQFYSRLPFLIDVIPVCANEKAAQKRPTAISIIRRNHDVALEPSVTLAPNGSSCLHTKQMYVIFASPSTTWATRPFLLKHETVPQVAQIKLINIRDTSESLLLQVNILSGHFRHLKGVTSFAVPGRWFVLSISPSPHFVVKNLSSVPITCRVGDSAAWDRKRKKRPGAWQFKKQTFASLINWIQEDEGTEFLQLAPQSGFIHHIPPWEDHTKSIINYTLPNSRKEKWVVASLTSVTTEVSETIWDVIVGASSSTTPKMEVSDRSRGDETGGESDGESILKKIRGYSQIKMCHHLAVNKEGVRILRISDDRLVLEKIRQGQAHHDDQETKAANSYALLQVPFVRLRFDFRLEKIRVTWIHSGRIALAFQMSVITLGGNLTPRNIPPWLYRPACRDADAYMLSEALSSNDPNGLDLLSGSNLGRHKRRHAPDGTYFTMREINSYALLTDPNKLAALQEMLRRQSQDMMNKVLLNGTFEIQFLIGGIHCDHFVEGDIPVIFKSSSLLPTKSRQVTSFRNPNVVVNVSPDNTARPRNDNEEGAILTRAVKEAFNEYLGSSSVRVENHALCAYVSKHLLHPTHASVYDVIALTIAPLIVNVEFDVLEQLASILEKEVAVIAIPTVTAAVLKAKQKTDSDTARLDSATNDFAASFVAPKTLHRVRRPPIIHRVRDLKKLTQINFKDCQQTVFLSSNLSAAPPVFYSLPRWNELKDTHAVYFQDVRLAPMHLQISLRTSGKKIDRTVLWIADSLPLDSPYMALSIPALEEKFQVLTWAELAARLQNFYINALIRRSLPSAWLFYLGAPVLGVIRGFKSLGTIVKEEFRCQKWSVVVSGCLAGFRLGCVLTLINLLGGAFHTTSHLCNMGHKIFKGSRPRPSGVIDAFKKGLVGFLTDTFWTPWRDLVIHTGNQIKRSDPMWKIAALGTLRLLRCALGVIMGSFNMAGSITEGLANALIGDFEQLTRIQESEDR